MTDYPDTPITREEKYLAAGLDGGDLPDPITREEQYLYEIATKMQGGGSAPVLETLTVTTNDTYTPDEGVDGFDEVVVDVPNPNSITVYETTLGGVPDLISMQDLETDTITAYLGDRESAIGFDCKMSLYVDHDWDLDIEALCASCFIRAGSGYPFFLYAEWARATKLLLAARLIYGEDGSTTIEFDSSTLCTLTVIRHPLPDNE